MVFLDGCSISCSWHAPHRLASWLFFHAHCACSFFMSGFHHDNCNNIINIAALFHHRFLLCLLPHTHTLFPSLFAQRILPLVYSKNLRFNECLYSGGGIIYIWGILYITSGYTVQLVHWDLSLLYRDKYSIAYFVSPVSLDYLFF